jgi:hypothetical protein
VELDEVFDEGEAESEPPLAPAAGAVSLPEALERLGKEVGGDPAPRVADGYRHVRSRA